MTTFDDVCVDPHIKEMLRTVVSLPILHPDRFQSGILAKESIMGVLLYGPPGTGKTMLCRALAHDCGARMIAVKPSDIFAMYVGESDKNAFAVFVSIVSEFQNSRLSDDKRSLRVSHTVLHLVLYL